MFQRKLKALGFSGGSDIDPNDDEQFRNIVLWLEDEKIGFYSSEDRVQLRDVKNSQTWQHGFDKYLNDLECPYNSNMDRKLLIDWLLGYAIRSEFADNELYEQRPDVSKSAPAKVCSNPLDNLDFESAEFKEGVHSIAKLLNIPSHPDHLVLLQGISKFVQERLSNAALQQASSKKEVTEKEPSAVLLKIEQFPLGFESTGDEIMDNAIRALRLLHVRELRALQTKINETIVAVQTVTANPKTDDKLGKGGR